MRVRNISARAIFLAAILLCTLTGVPALYGQATDGNLVGTVVDPTGAVIPGATVEITNTATSVKGTTTTNAAGQYRFNNLLPGAYEMKVTKTGFSSASLKNIAVALNASATQNVNLQVGDVSQTVEVTESGTLIDTTTAQIGATFQAREAIDTPLSSQPTGVLNLALLAAGVASSGGIGLGDGPSVGGQRPRQNNFSVEGVDNNRKDVTGHNVDIPNEAVAEFTMIQNQYLAEFGNGTGGQFNTSLKSGGNEIHGAVFEYLQNRNLNAVDQSSARAGILTNTRYDQNRLGGSVGGPIVKNKLFYYGLFEYNPTGSAATPDSSIYAPTAAGFTSLASIPGVSQTNLNILKQYLPPAASSSATTSVNGVSIPIGIIPVTKPSFTNIYNWLVNGDYNISDFDRLRVRFVNNITKGFSDTTLPALPAFFLGRNTTAKLFTLSEFHTFSPTVLNEFRFGYNRYNDAIPSGDFQFPGLDVFPNIQIEQDLNLQLGPFTGAPQSGIINTYQLIDNVSWNRGNHNFKFGFEGRKYIAPQVFVQRVRGDYDYNTLGQYLLDRSPDVLAERNVGGAVYSGNQANIYWYAQDEWRFRPNFTVTLGVRYEYKGVPRDEKLQTLNAISSVPGLLEFREPQADKNNWAPRVGLAYSPGRDAKTTFRAGFGMAYDKYFDNLGLLTTPPQISSTADIDPAANTPDFLKNGGIKPNAAGAAVCTGAAECRSITSSYRYDHQLPYSIQWNAGVQHVFRNNYTVEVRYLGTRGVHLFTQTRLNSLAPVTPERSLPTFFSRPAASALSGLTTSLGDLLGQPRIVAEYAPYFPANITAFPNRGNSSYHGLAMEITRRFTRGLLFKGAYTWSHNIDDSTADLFSTLLSPRRPQDFQNMRPERSNSFLDRRHRLTFNWVWDTPWFNGSSNAIVKNTLGNWTLAGTYIYESPQFATVQSAVDSNLNGDNAGDRAIVNVNGTPNTGTGVFGLDRAGNTIPAVTACSAGQPCRNIVAYVANDPNAQYVIASLGAFPNAGRQTLSQNPINTWDFELKKQIRFGEVMRLQLAGQFYNTFNHPQYVPGYINNVQFHSSMDTRNHLIPNNPQFNRPDLVYSRNPRTVQITARFQF